MRCGQPRRYTEAASQTVDREPSASLVAVVFLTSISFPRLSSQSGALICLEVGWKARLKYISFTLKQVCAQVTSEVEGVRVLDQEIFWCTCSC